MPLIQKVDMIDKDWRTFEHYPQHRSDIVLHISGYRVRKGKRCHDFIRIKRFNAKTFDKRDYTPTIESVKWDYSWLPSKFLEAPQQ